MLSVRLGLWQKPAMNITKTNGCQELVLLFEKRPKTAA